MPEVITEQISSSEHQNIISNSTTSDWDNADIDSTGNTSNLLCCCEYIDENHQRNHILACCCNCSEFDQTCESLLCCQHISSNQISNTMFMISDRIRIPWRGGARKMPIDIILPIILVPSLLYIAAHSMWHSFTIFMCLPLGLCYIHYYAVKYIPDTKFFIIWAITSILLIYIIFQWNVVPILMITMEENILFLIFLLSSCYCLVRTKLLAKSCHVKNYSVLPSSSTESIVNMSDTGSVESLNINFNFASETICPVCCKRVPSRTYHCNVCHVCVYKRDLHCVWLDCCIGEKNHRMYMLGLFLMTVCLLFASNLILITVCSPIDLFLTVKIPRDCSEVYIDIMFAQYFVVSIYCIIISLFLLSLLIHETYMISLGMTGHEWRLSSNQRKFWCLRPKSMYSKGFWKNWQSYLNI